MPALIRLLLTVLTEEGTALQIFKKVFKTEIKKFGKELFTPKNALKGVIKG